MASTGSSRYFTILLVPEKTDRVRKLVVPGWLLRGASVLLAVTVLLGMVMVLDYWFVMGQVAENRDLRLENRRLRQQVQVFENKVSSMESTLERIRTFATRLRVITNIEERGSLLQGFHPQLPEANANVGIPATAAQAPRVAEASVVGLPPEDLELQADYDRMDRRFSTLQGDMLFTEQVLQDQYELLWDQRAFLAALPTRRPAVGYFTSGFGIRRAPHGGKVKMHEGLDIANRPDTAIHAPADGMVLFADTKAGYGNTLILDHGYGLETWYGHTRRILVKKGQKVRRGEMVAKLGSTGRSTGPHVHYEVRVNGTPVDPLPFILEE